MMNNFQQIAFYNKKNNNSITKNTLLSFGNQQKKYVPSPEAAEIIMSYFMYKNFQDFNTWQQIAKTKSQFQFVQTNKGTHQCRMYLKWQEKSANIMPMIQIGQGKNKKQAKRNTLQKMIEDLMYQGYISKGFRQQDFVKRLPRRRKQQSSDSQEEQSIEIIKIQNKTKQLLIEGKFYQALQLISEDNFIELWQFALGKRSIKLCKNVLLALQKKYDQIDKDTMQVQSQINLRQEHCKEQIKNSKRENSEKLLQQQFNISNSPYDDLTDFLQYYQLQWQKKSIEIQGQSLPSKILPSEALIGKQLTKRQDLFKEFFPIEKTLDFQKHFISLNQFKSQQINSKRQLYPFFTLPYKISYPVFEEQFNQISNVSLQILYDGLLFYSNDLSFSEQVAKMINNQIESIRIKTKSKSTQKGIQQSSKYFLKQKHLITCQFLKLLNLKIDNPQITLQGMIIQTSGKSAYTLLTFTPKQPQQYVSEKISKKTNLNQFQESFQILSNQYVLLVSKIDQSQKYIAYVKQVSPSIKLICPQLPFELNVPKPLTMCKINNGKIYQRTSSALSQVCKYILLSNPNFFFNNVYIFWQPSIHNNFFLIVQLLCELCQYELPVLIITSQVEFMYEQLTKLGFKSAKVSSKFDDKSMVKAQVVCSTSIGTCCQAIKNYAFQRVIIDQAHQISQIMSLMAISKGCKKLYLIGDINFPKNKTLSKYCTSKKMNISLIQRLINSGIKYHTYHSVKDQLLISPQILQWPNKQFYKGQLLNNVSNYIPVPIVKGFPWPLQEARIAFVDISNNNNNLKYIHFCIQLISSLLKTKFIQIDDIYCLVNNGKIKNQLKIKLLKFLKENYDQQNKITHLIIDKMIKIIDGQKPLLRQFAVVLIQNYNPQQWDQRLLNICFFHAKRGIIFIGDIKNIFQINNNNNYNNNNKNAFNSFLNWCCIKKLILKYQYKQ